MVVSPFYSCVDRLVDFPLSGRQVPELNDSALREIIADVYRIIYEIDGDSIGILTVIHGGQDLLGKLG